MRWIYAHEIDWWDPGALRYLRIALVVASVVGWPAVGWSTCALDAAIGAQLAYRGEIEVIVALRPTTASSDPRALVRAQQDAVVAAVPPGLMRVRRRYSRLRGFAAAVTAEGYRRVRNHPDVAGVYPSRPLMVSLAEGRALTRTEAVQRAGVDGGGITAAVIDTGIDYANWNLGGCLGPGCKVAAGYDFVNDDDDPVDDHGHGTAVAGILAADASHPDSGRRVRGIAPGTRLVALKVLDQTGTGDLVALEAALDWILEYNADPDRARGERIRVVNLSLGDGMRYDDSSVCPCSGSLAAEAIAALLADGVTVVVAAGNSGFDDGAEFPACVPGVLAVGAVYDADVGATEFASCGDAVTAAGQITCYSNLGALVSVVAPANDARTTSLGRGGIRFGFGGTSAAAPYVAGVSALVLQAGPTLSSAEVTSRLRARAALFVSDPERSPLSFPLIDGVAQMSPDDDGDGIVLGEAYCAGDVRAGCDDNCPAVFNPLQHDGDGDGIGDACDGCGSANSSPWDQDGDGWPNDCDDCAAASDPLQIDDDGDGLGDACDNCPQRANAEQHDADEDGAGDVCDPCSDGDADGLGAPGDVCGTDNCPEVHNPGQDDWDHDGRGDACDCVTTYPIVLPLAEEPTLMSEGLDPFGAVAVDRRGQVAATFTGLGGSEVRSGMPGSMELLGPGRDPALDSSGRILVMVSSSDLGGRNPDGSTEILLWKQRRSEGGRGRTFSLVGQITDGVACESLSPVPSSGGRVIAYASTCDPTGRNADGNQEIFLYDHQRERTFQMTDTVGCASGPLGPAFPAGPSIETAGRSLVFQSSCRFDEDDPDAAAGPFVYHLAWRSRRDPLAAARAPVRLPSCAGCTASYGAVLRRSTVGYWSDGRGAFPAGMRLRWVTLRGRARLAELCRHPLGATVDPLPSTPVIDGRSLLYIGTFNPTGANPEGRPQLFLTDIAGRPGATRQLTGQGTLPGARMSSSERYAVFGAPDENGAPALFRIKFR